MVTARTMHGTGQRGCAISSRLIEMLKSGKG
jgi:hypothetical protein